MSHAATVANPYVPATSIPAGLAPKPVSIPPTQAATHRSFGRLVHAEFRKLVDTRTGLWLLIAMGLLTIIVTFVNTLYMGYVAKSGLTVPGMPPLNLLTAASGGAGIMAMFIAILAILSIAGEWGQRTTLTTFALEPRRGLVLAAKAVVVLLLATLFVAISFPLGALGEAVAHATFHVPVSYHASAAGVFGFWLSLMIGGPLLGMALGLLVLNTPAGIVTYLLLPMLLNVLGMIQLAWKPFAKVVKWTNPSDAQAPFAAGAWHLADFGPLAATSLIWIVVPAAVGTWRWLRRECK